MRRAFAAVLGWCLFAVPASAQRPVAESITEVRTVLVQGPDGAEGFDKYLADSLRAWGQWKVATDPSQPHDAVLVELYGCDPLSFRYREVSRGKGWTICDVSLLDSYLLARHTVADVWEMPLGKLQDAFLQADPLDFPPPAHFEMLADAIVFGLRRSWGIASGVRSADPPASLASVRSIYVTLGDFSSIEDVAFEKILAASLMARDKEGRGIGDCKQGYTSVVPSVRLVCYMPEADAILVSAGPQPVQRRTHVESQGSGTVTLQDYGSYEEGDIRFSQQMEIWDETISEGGAMLYDRDTMQELWSTYKNGEPPAWARITNDLLEWGNPRPGGISVIAERTAKQLAKDIEKAREQSR